MGYVEVNERTLGGRVVAAARGVFNRIRGGRSIVKRALLLLGGCLLLVLPAASTPEKVHSRAQQVDPLVLLTIIDVGGTPDAIVVDCCGERNDVIIMTAAPVRCAS